MSLRLQKMLAGSSLFSICPLVSLTFIFGVSNFQACSCVHRSRNAWEVGDHNHYSWSSTWVTTLLLQLAMAQTLLLQLAMAQK